MMFIAVYLSYDVCKCWPENLLCRGGWKLIKYTLSLSDDSVNNSGIMGEIDWGLRYKPYRAYKEYISVEESRVNKGPHSEGSIIYPSWQTCETDPGHSADSKWTHKSCEPLYTWITSSWEEEMGRASRRPQRRKKPPAFFLSRYLY